jgi:tight adherence protein C
MTPALYFIGGIASAGGCVAAVTGMAWRALHLRGQRERLDVALPLVLRMTLGPARSLAPLLEILPQVRRNARLQRALEAAELYPQVNPATWTALRVVHALLAAGVAILVGRMLSMGSMVIVLVAAAWGLACAPLWLRRTQAERARRIVRDLPAYLDLLTVCVEAGATLTAGVRLIVDQAPASPLRNYFDRVLREVRGGRTRAQAFLQVAGQFQVESLSALAGALAHAEASGMSLGRVLRAQAEQRTAERFARAEKLAMQAPVKLLGPLILCIFPCTFIVLAVPIAYRLLEAFNT